MTESQSRFVQALIVLLGVFALAVVLAFHNITDGDLWAKLAIGSSLWNTGHLLRHDVYAFTPTLPQYIDHEWGAGVVFYALLQWFGPSSLIVLRMLTAVCPPTVVALTLANCEPSPASTLFVLVMINGLLYTP